MRYCRINVITNGDFKRTGIPVRREFCKLPMINRLPQIEAHTAVQSDEMFDFLMMYIVSFLEIIGMFQSSSVLYKDVVSGSLE